MKMTQLEIIDDIEQTIKENKENNDPHDYVENCLYFDKQGFADYYQQTIPQIVYLTNRALLRFDV